MQKPDAPSSTLKVILIGVGGASCTGKTTLAKYLKACLPNSFIIHQDDFAPVSRFHSMFDVILKHPANNKPTELVPFNAEYGVQDWDDAPGAILWDKMAEELAHVKRQGHLSDAYSSHDHLNEQAKVPVDDGLVEGWTKKFQELEDQALSKGEKIVWAIVDGFILYWDPAVYESLDVCIFLREPEAVLRARRKGRDGYFTGEQSNSSEGSLWKDPPMYWEQIVYPAYKRAHEELFVGGDVETGELTGKVKDLIMFEALTTTISGILDESCKHVLTVAIRE